MNVWKIDDALVLMGDGLPVDRPRKGHLEVLVAPPAEQPGYARRWVTELDPRRDTRTFGDPGSGSWEVIQDHRTDKLWIAHGQPYTLGADHDGQKYDGLGPVPGWLHTDEPPLPLVDAKTLQRAIITAAADAAIDGGFEHNGHVYDSDLVSRTNIIGTANAVNSGIELPESFTWRTQDNQDVPMDGAGIIALGAALLVHVNEQYATSWALKAQIDVAETVEDVRAVVWPSGSEA